MKDLTIAVDDRPGALAEMGEALGRAGEPCSVWRQPLRGPRGRMADAGINITAVCEDWMRDATRR